MKSFTGIVTKRFFVLRVTNRRLTSSGNGTPTLGIARLVVAMVQVCRCRRQPFLIARDWLKMKNPDAPAVKREARRSGVKKSGNDRRAASNSLHSPCSSDCRRVYRVHVVVRVTGKNRIMIYGPKDDGTYVVEFRTAGCRRARNIDSELRSGSDPAFPRPHALWLIHGGCKQPCVGRSGNWTAPSAVRFCVGP